MKHHSPAHHRNERKEILTPQRDIGAKQAANFAMSIICIQQKLVKAVKEAQKGGKTVQGYYIVIENILCDFARVC